MSRTRIAMVVAVMTLMGLGLQTLVAQPADRNGGGDRAAMRAQFMQRMLERTKEGMGVTDDEWKVIQPRLEKVQTLLMQTRMGGMMRGGRGGDAQEAQPQNDVAKAAQELRTAVENADTAPSILKDKVEALRKARAKANEELAAAQKNLRELLSVRQEAYLIMAGMLD